MRPCDGPEGCQTAHYHFDWAQSLEEVLVEVQVPVNVTVHDVVVQFDVQSLLVLVGNKSIISGTLAGPIIPEESSWSLGEVLWQPMGAPRTQL
jgi:hypothetical protein